MLLQESIDKKCKEAEEWLQASNDKMLDKAIFTDLQTINYTNRYKNVLKRFLYDDLLNTDKVIIIDMLKEAAEDEDNELNIQRLFFGGHND